jgi:hypothetical protein
MRQIALLTLAALLVVAGCTYRQLDRYGRSKRPSTYQITHPDTALSRTGKGKITGRVLSEDGEGVMGAAILVRETKQGATVQSVDGTFWILGVRPGSYTLRASAIGFAEITTETLTVYPGLTTIVDFKLSEETLMGEETTASASH